MFKRKRKYKEAYLEIKRGKIKEKEKIRRIELGEDNKRMIKEIEKHGNTATTAREGSADWDEESGGVGFSEEPEYRDEEREEDFQLPPEMEEDERVVERPKSKWAWAGLLFWVLFLLTSVQFFWPHLDQTLNYTIDYSLDWSKGAKKEEVDKPEPVVEESEAKPADKESEEASTNQVMDQFQETVPGMWEEAKNVVDDATVYARVHNLVSETALDLRNTTSRYVQRKGHHIEMAAISGQITTKMSQARTLLSATEKNDLHQNLLARVERLEAVGQDSKEWERDTAADKANEFVRAENTDSQAFLDWFAEYLASQGRTYNLEDGKLNVE